MLELYINIKKRRLELGLTQTELAKLVGYADKSMIARIEAGSVDLPQSKIEIFAKVLKTTAPDLMGWNEDNNASASIDPATISNLHTPGAYRVPILGEICAGDGVFTEEDFKGWFFLDGTIKCDYVLEVKGDSMEDAGIFDGDRVMILRTYDYFGKICAVVIRDTNEAVLKRVDATSNKLVLTSYNKKYEPMIYEEQDVLIVGECVGVYHAWEDEEK